MRDIALLQTVDHLESQNRNINKVEFNHLDPEVFIAGTMGGVIIQWDLRTQQPIDRPINSKQPIRNVSMPFYRLKQTDHGLAMQLAYCPHDKNLFASANDEGVVMVYDRRKGQTPVSRVLAHHGPAYALAWHPRNRGELATGGRDKTIRILYNELSDELQDRHLTL